MRNLREGFCAKQKAQKTKQKDSVEETCYLRMFEKPTKAEVKL
jgi:hypothetical protein